MKNNQISSLGVGPISGDSNNLKQKVNFLILILFQAQIINDFNL